MDNREATEKFQAAEALYNEGRYSEALTILNELGEAFPGTKNILYPRARCLYKLERHDEARYVAELLIDKFADPRADDLLKRIKAKQVPPPTFNAAAPDQGLQAPPPTGGQPPPPPGQAPPPLPGQPPAPPQDPMAGLGQVPDPMAFDSDMPSADILGEGGIGPAYGPNDSMFGVQPQGAAPPPPSLQPESNKKKVLLWVLGGVVAVILIGFLSLPLFTGGGDGRTAEAPAPSEGAGEGAGTEAPVDDLTIRWKGYQEVLGDMDARYADFDSYPPPTLIFFSSPDSEDCQKMERQVFEDASIVLLMDGWDFVKVNPEEEPSAATDFMVESVPTVIVLGLWGQESYREEGYVSPSKFYEAIADLGLEPWQPPEIPQMAIGILVFFLALLLIAPIFCLYIALLLTGKLPYNVITQDLMHITGTIFISYLICLIPCVGGFIAMYFIIVRYEMGFVDVVIYVAMNMGIGFVLGFLMALSMGIPPAEFFGNMSGSF